MTFLLLAALIFQPLQIAFYSTTSVGDETEGPEIAILSSTLAFFFFVDICLNFRTGTIDSKSDVVVLDRSEASRYINLSHI